MRQLNFHFNQCYKYDLDLSRLFLALLLSSCHYSLNFCIICNPSCDLCSHFSIFRHNVVSTCSLSIPGTMVIYIIFISGHVCAFFILAYIFHGVFSSTVGFQFKPYTVSTQSFDLCFVHLAYFFFDTASCIIYFFFFFACASYTALDFS